MRLNADQALALERLSAVMPVTPKAMFGGIGIYAEGLFFALMDDSHLYLKVDDANRPAFERRGLGPFQPYADRGGPPMQYYPVPDDVLADPGALREWATGALDVARRAARRTRKSPPAARR